MNCGAFFSTGKCPKKVREKIKRRNVFLIYSSYKKNVSRYIQVSCAVACESLNLRSKSAYLRTGDSGFGLWKTICKAEEEFV